MERELHSKSEVLTRSQLAVVDGLRYHTCPAAAENHAPVTHKCRRHTPRLIHARVVPPRVSTAVVSRMSTVRSETFRMSDRQLMMVVLDDTSRIIASTAS